MSGTQAEKRHPSAEEFNGRYNLGYTRPDGQPVLQSQKQVPEFEHAEFLDLYIAENPWFEQLVPASALKPFDPIADPPMFVVSDADDRTLTICADFDYLTVDLLRRIQQEFLGRHPLWRVIVAADHPSCTIVIYPDAIRFGNSPVGVEPEPALRELVSRAVALREARQRPERDQLAFLRQRLPDALRTIGSRQFFVAGVLDNNKGDYNWLSIFLLIRGADHRAIAIEGPAEVDNDFLWTGGAFGVDSHGTIISDSSIPESASSCIALWYPRADYRGPLTIVEQETGRRHPYELKSENITPTS